MSARRVAHSRRPETNQKETKSRAQSATRARTRARATRASAMTRAQYFGASCRRDEGERRARARSRARMRARVARQATDRSELARLSSRRHHRRGDRRRVVRRVDPHRALAERARARGGGAFARRPSPATFARLARASDETRRDAARRPTDRSTDLARVSSSQAPAYVIAAFALCSLAVIARSVVFFPSCAAEAAALARDVSRARADLLAAGVLTAEDFDRADDASD